MVRLRLPSLSVDAILAGGILRLISAVFAWSLTLVWASEIMLYLGVAWLILFDIFPIFLPPFYYLMKKFQKRWTFFFYLLVFFFIFELAADLLPSGGVKDTMTGLAFLSFWSSILWLIGLYFYTSSAPVVKYLRRKPREVERITFADIVTSMAVVIAPTVILSFWYAPAGLSASSISAYQVFLTSLLTDIFIAAYIYLFIVRPKVFTWRQLGVRSVDKEDFGRAIVLFILVSVMLVIVHQILQRLGIPVQNYSFASKNGYRYAIAMLVFVTPVVEELYFRGFLFRGLTFYHKKWIAYLISAFIFAILHTPLIVMGEIFIVGLLLDYVIDETKSIWPGVFIHAINNALILGYLLLK